MKEKQHYFTRLTSNFNNWKIPSGRDGKCQSQSGALYEEVNGFGWEEWLFEEYHANKSKPSHICHGFVQAFNNNKSDVEIDRLYLYTKVGRNKKGIKPGCYYVGYINNVKKIKLVSRNFNEVREQLNLVGISGNGFKPMLPKAYNLTFQVKDVHINFPKVYCQPIKLARGQYRFGLYDVVVHRNFLKEINKY